MVPAKRERFLLVKRLELHSKKKNMRIMKNEKAISDLLKRQLKLENEIAKRFRKLEEQVDSLAARLLIREMQLDTKKHAEILETALKAIGGPKSFLGL